MRESRTYGSVRGAVRKGGPYRDPNFHWYMPAVLIVQKTTAALVRKMHAVVAVGALCAFTPFLWSRGILVLHHYSIV